MQFLRSFVTGQSMRALKQPGKIARKFCMSRALRRLAVTVLAAFLLPTFPALANTCTVVSDADSGPGTLRDLIADAGCDVIDFQGVALITVDLDLQILREVTINGPGADLLTLSGGETSRVFSILPGVGPVLISGVTITDGRANPGGGVSNEGTLLVTNSVISRNRPILGTFDGDGGGIFNTGTLTVRNTLITLNGGMVTFRFGGGIFNSGTATVENSTIFRNWLFLGGGIYNEGMLTLTNSTVSGNTSFANGGILNLASGTMNVTNTTVSGNSGFIFVSGINNIGTMTLTSSTVSGNRSSNTSGAPVDQIANQNVLTIKNSIIGGNAYGVNCVGSFTSLGLNLSDDSSCSGFTQVDDVKLGRIADNGGPSETHALLEDSPAIDAVTDCTLQDGVTPLNTDQRGVLRPQGSACDVGAFEFEQAISIDAIIASVDAAVGNGALIGDGPGRSAKGRLGAWRNMLNAVELMLESNNVAGACVQLQDVYVRSDGGFPPPDFVTGPGVPTLANMIQALQVELGCS